MDGYRQLTAMLGQDYDLHIVLIDDGSKDSTAEEARSKATGLQLTILAHEINKGPGAAFATGFAHLADILRDIDWIITMEGDNTSRHTLILQLFTRSKEGYDVVLASPYMYGGGMDNTSFIRTVMSNVANLLVKELLGIHGIFTMSSFFRLYSAPVILKLQKRYGPGVVERTGFESMIELIMKMIIQGVTISEVPMVLDTSLRKGKSKMKVLRTIVGYLTLWKDKKRWSQ